MFHKVVQVYPTDDYKVYIYFVGKFDPSNCLDLDPEELYNSSPEVEEPNFPA